MTPIPKVTANDIEQKANLEISRNNRWNIMNQMYLGSDQLI